ncbi:MAG: diguanylate cyclase [Vicinamibacteria bacterium]|nr:diguanylate cyclase [Vicinamibacteria bacterium]MBP9947847.1 diguanylate cyclase [Vicinamibacteria bacterium]
MPSFIPDFIPNLTRLGFIALLLAVAFVVAARFRHFWGTTPIAVLAGLLQVPQTILAISLSVGVLPGISVSPGSVIFFPATLFAILLVYVLEDEAETRRLIYGILIANLTLAVLIFIGQPLFDLPSGANSLGLDAATASRVSRVLIVGAGLLAVDAFILIRAFEWFGERVSRNVLARALFALILSVGFDALAFGPIAFGGRPFFGTLVTVGFVGKVAAASFYSLAFVFLLPWSRMSAERDTSPRLRRNTGPVTYKDRFRDLQKEAVRDSLTGVFNRAYFDHELRVQAERAIVRGDRLLLLLIDLDAFKQINDTHGHPAGDRVLSLFGEALRAVARQNDTVCRYGGEEFAILIAGGPTQIAPGLFERTTEEFDRLWAGATPPFTFSAPRFSVGGATIPDDARSADALLAAADQRLYASKRAGGNRLTIA